MAFFFFPRYNQGEKTLKQEIVCFKPANLPETIVVNYSELIVLS